MKCPHCRKELKYPQRAYYNVTTYHRRALVTTECCFKVVALEVEYKVTAANDEAVEDE